MLHVRNLVLGEEMTKIAVPVMLAGSKVTAARCAAAAEAGADLIELRADAFLEQMAEQRAAGTDTCGSTGAEKSAAGADNSAQALLEVLRSARAASGELPLIFTVRTRREGGFFSGTEEAYAASVLAAMGSGLVDLLDVEHRHRRSGELLAAAREAACPVILSFHSFTSTPERVELLAVLREMELRGAQVAKIACMPGSRRDLYALLAAGAEAKRCLRIPFLVIGMGELGKPTRTLAESYGSALTFGCLPGEESAPGQIEVGELSELLKAQHRLCEERRERPHIFLTGFMGCGKTSAARALGAESQRPVVEMDEEIALRAGMSIPRIFEERGEEAFRDMETGLLAELAMKEGSVVSCGGGAVLREENRLLMHCLGAVVLLTASPKTLLARLRGEAEERPVLKGHFSERGIAALMAERLPHYEAAADAIVDTDGRSVQAVAERILEWESARQKTQFPD